MRALRRVTIGLVALVGVLLGILIFIALGLFAVSPPSVGPAAAGQDWDVAIELTDAFLTAQLNKEQPAGGSAQPSASASGGPGGGRPSIGGGGGGAQGGGLKLTNAKAAMHADGTVDITGNYAVAGRSVAVEIVMKPTATPDGKLAVEIVKAQFGPVPVPSGVSGLLEGPITDQINKAMNNQPFTITAVTLRDGAMTVRARQAAR